MKPTSSYVFEKGMPYPETTMFGAIKIAAERTPDAPALDFMGKVTSYRTFLEKIEAVAKAFVNYGLKEGDVVTICMPNTPQAVICLYALNRIGAIANMVHPLSSQKNITYYLDYSESKMILTLDMFYEKVKAAIGESKTNATVITARIEEELSFIKATAFKYIKNKPNHKFPNDERDFLWSDFMKTGEGVELPEVVYDKSKTAVILYSGGTSGTPKGIMLSDFNFNALGYQVAEITGCSMGNGIKFLSVMPVFHGFGLGIGIHTVLEHGAMCILIPIFNEESYAKAVIKNKPNFIAGVPTLYEALLKNKKLQKADLSFLLGVFSGGDTLSPELKKRADAFLRAHNANIQIREGYGLTECVTASCVTPIDRHKEGSIGLPLRDMIYKIVEPGTFNELPTGEKGEIIISGPTLMLGYMKEEEENAKTLRTDDKGTTWMFTGDMGYIDEDGFVYFKQRIKRLIVTSGYNVFPTHVENILDKHEAVDYCCVIGVKDPYKMQRVRAYIVLKEGYEASEETKQKILEHCKIYLDSFEKPKEIIFKKELPRTLVGKVAYHELEIEAEKEQAEKENTNV